MHQMKLYDDPFRRIVSGEKTIELRLNDEKRRLVREGDGITFTNIDTGERIVTRCKALYRADSFVQLFYILTDKEKMGFKHHETPEEMSNQMRLYYSNEKEQKYGVLAIEVECVK